MPFLRFVVARLDPNSGAKQGVFAVAYGLRDSPSVEAGDREMLAENLRWFEEHLETPNRFNRTTSKGFYRRNTRGIAWFKDTATEHLRRMHQIVAVLERYGHHVEIVAESKVGYVVYDDPIQVVAEPFGDTRTRWG
jgi:hypothetical protein